MWKRSQALLGSNCLITGDSGLHQAYWAALFGSGMWVAGRSWPGS